jgi:F0F1-type ATP synthase membrane subunit c/vacuolar-type H+-ATPase subunit K
VNLAELIGMFASSYIAEIYLVLILNLLIGISCVLPLTFYMYASFLLYSVIFCEAVAIYGVIVAIILQTKLESVPTSRMHDPESMRAGYAIFASGLIVGFANLVCG